MISASPENEVEGIDLPDGGQPIIHFLVRRKCGRFYSHPHRSCERNYNGEITVDTDLECQV